MFNLWGLIGAACGVAARVIFGYVMLNAGKPFDWKYLRGAVIGALLGMATSFAWGSLTPQADPWQAFASGFGVGFAWAAAAQIAVSAGDRKKIDADEIAGVVTDAAKRLLK
jgi:hypothetical protein